MAILLIGSTGNGKSSLGNFLINPDDAHLWKHPTFATAKSNLPETQRVRDELSRIKLPGQKGNFEFRVIDTPGLNEKSADLRHMIDIIETFKSVSFIHACILVVKFDSKIDAQYESTVRYYSKLLPSLFEKNVIVVMTDFATDERSVLQREKRGVSIVDVKRNTVEAIVKSGCLSYEPVVFTIDSLPFDDEERELNLAERVSILQYISSLRPVELETSKVAKTDYIKQKDDAVIGKFEGEISGYNKRLQETGEKYSAKIKEIERVEKKITDMRSQIKTLKEAMDEKNTPNLVVVNTWNFNKTWKFFKKREKEFEIFVPFEDVKVTKWDKGSCTWEKFKSTLKEDGTGTIVSGILIGNFMRGLYATVTVETKKQDKYAVQILELKKKIESSEKNEKELENELRRTLLNTEECRNEVELLRVYIDEKRKLIDEYNSDWMTLEEAYAKLCEMKKQT